MKKEIDFIIACLKNRITLLEEDIKEKEIRKSTLNMFLKELENYKEGISTLE